MYFSSFSYFVCPKESFWPNCANIHQYVREKSCFPKANNGGDTRLQFPLFFCCLVPSFLLSCHFHFPPFLPPFYHSMLRLLPRVIPDSLPSVISSSLSLPPTLPLSAAFISPSLTLSPFLPAVCIHWCGAVRCGARPSSVRRAAL